MKKTVVILLTAVFAAALLSGCASSGNELQSYFREERRAEEIDGFLKRQEMDFTEARAALFEGRSLEELDKTERYNLAQMAHLELGEASETLPAPEPVQLPTPTPAQTSTPTPEPTPTAEPTPEPVPSPAEAAAEKADDEAFTEPIPEDEYTARTGRELPTEKEKLKVTAQTDNFIVGNADKNGYVGEKACDGDPKTSWQYKKAEEGSIRFAFDGIQTVRCIGFRLGSWESESKYNSNCTPETLAIGYDGGSVEYTFPHEQKLYYVCFPDPIETNRITIEVRKYYEGGTEVAVAEVSFYADAAADND